MRQLDRLGSNLPFAANVRKVRFGPLVTLQGIWGGDFASVAICALLPLGLGAANSRFQPFYDIGAQCSMEDI